MGWSAQIEGYTAHRAASQITSPQQSRREKRYSASLPYQLTIRGQQRRATITIANMSKICILKTSTQQHRPTPL
jgi:hypothetical protein